MIFRTHQKSVLSIATIVMILSVVFLSVMVTSADCTVDGSSGNQGDGSNNTIVCDAANDPAGANVRGHDGDDSITVDNGATAGTVNGDNDNDTIIVNGTVNNANGNDGDDSITVDGTANNNANGGAGDDNIIVNGTVNNNVVGGDNNDNITINGTVNNIVSGGNDDDTIIIEGTVVSNVSGANGDDTVIVNGTVNNANGGADNDTVIVNGTANNNANAGAGDDVVIVNGTVVNTVAGSDGNDTLIINANGSANNVNGGNDADTITVNGTVNNNVTGAAGDDTIVINGTVNNTVAGGNDNDSITINGTVNTNVTGGDGDDSIVLLTNAIINGLINGNSGTDTLSFNMVLCITDGRDFDAINARIESSSATDTLTLAGITYEWKNIENFEGNVIPEDCYTADEVSAFLDFGDGRLNGLQCATWVDDTSMTVYDVNGFDAVSISADMLTVVPLENTLLAQNSANSVRIYHLASGEIQVHCDTWDSVLNQTKTESYIFQNLSDFAPQVIH